MLLRWGGLTDRGWEAAMRRRFEEGGVSLRLVDRVIWSYARYLMKSAQIHLQHCGSGGHHNAEDPEYSYLS